MRTNPSRRLALSLISTGTFVLAGCLRGSNTDPPTSSTPLTISEVRVTSTNNSSSPLELSVEILDDTITQNTPGQLRFVLSNTGSEQITVQSGPIPPFGPLQANSSENKGFYLWNDEYENSSHVQIDDTSISVAAVQFDMQIPAGSSRSREYTILYDTASPGEYAIAPIVDARQGGINVDNVEYRVQLVLSTSL